MIWDALYKLNKNLSRLFVCIRYKSRRLTQSGQKKLCGSSHDTRKFCLLNKYFENAPLKKIHPKFFFQNDQKWRL